MMFQVGDTVIHPGYGAGTVVVIEKLQCLGSDKLYYSVELSDEAKTRMWIPFQDAKEMGVRHRRSGGAKYGKGRTVFLGKVTRRALWRHLAEREEVQE